MGLSHSPSITTDGLVLCLDAANRRSYPGNGNSWLDLSGNNENFSMINGAAFSPAQKGSIQYDGVNDYTRSTTFFTGDYWNNDDPWTVVCWHKIDSAISNASGLFSNQRYYSESNPGGFGLMLYGYNQNKYYVLMTHDDGVGTKTQYGHASGGAIDYGQITHISATYNPNDAGNKRIAIYKNGSLLSTATNSAYKWSTRTSGVETRIGVGVQGGWTFYWPGNIYSVLVYNTSLSSDEIRKNYLATKSRFGL